MMYANEKSGAKCLLLHKHIRIHGLKKGNRFIKKIKPVEEEKKEKRVTSKHLRQ